MAYVKNTPGSSSTLGSPLTFSYTVATGDTLLLMAVGARVTGVSTLSVTYNGVAMAQINAGVRTIGAGPDSVGSALFYLPNPATGANNVVVSGTGTVVSLIGVAMSVAGLDLLVAIPRDKAKSNGNSSGPSDTISPSLEDELVFDVIAAATAVAAPTATATSPQNDDGNLSRGGAGALRTAASDQSGANSITSAWTLSGTPDWVHCMASFVPDDRPKLRSLMGCGR